MNEIKFQTIGHTWEPNNSLSPNIIESRYCVLPQVASPKRSCYPYWVIDYDFISSCDYRLDNQPAWQNRPAGRVHLYPPNTVYWEKPKREIKHTKCSWLLFNGKLDNHLENFIKLRGHGVLIDDGRIGTLLKSAAETSQQQGQSAYWKTHSILADILNMFSKAQTVEAGLWKIYPEELSHQSELSLAEDVTNYLRNHLVEKITVEKIAEHFGISESSLAHKYRNETDSTPIATLISMRIELAKTLLRRGYKLQYIATHTGFSDEYHLAKTFKKITGQTPGQFIRQS